MKSSFNTTAPEYEKKTKVCGWVTTSSVERLHQGRSNDPRQEHISYPTMTSKISTSLSISHQLFTSPIINQQLLSLHT
jgi:hypothetical protein